MLNLADLGLTPAPSATHEHGAVAVDSGHLATPEARSRGLVAGSALARALYAAWSGEAVTIVDSPPGAGKTSLLVDLLVQLSTRSDLKVVVGTPTRRGAQDVAGRLAATLAEVEPDPKRRPQVVLSVKNIDLPEGVVSSTNHAKSPRGVVVRTISSCAHNPPECDLLIFDEAYQATFAQVMEAADNAKQVLMVGDPGQIGPVVTHDTSVWDSLRTAPHHRAPEVFAQRDDVTVLQLDATYRLGQATVDAIAPLYDFPFGSKRPDRWLLDRDGARMPELAALRIPAPDGGISDLGPMKAVAEAAYAMVGREVAETDADGTVTTRRLTQADVAVVVSHNVQQSGVRAVLESMAMEDITVGTADSLQGGQWHAVVALDAIVGHARLTQHQLSQGRLCVMASRHMTHLTWVHDGTSEGILTAYAEEYPREAAAGIAVRRALIAQADS